MKFRCPYCKHTIGDEPVPICPSCKKAIKVPGHLKESVDKINDEKEKQKFSTPLQAPTIFSSLLSFNSPVITITIIMLALSAVLYYKWSKSPYKYSDIEFNDSKTITEKLANVSFDMARKELWNLRMALEMFKRDCGRYPTTKEGIIALINNPGELTWKGPYVTFTRFDPWKRPYQYSSTNDTLRLFSCGPDLNPDTADDILVAELSDKDRTDYGLPAAPAPTNTPPAAP